MAEILVKFDEAVAAADGKRYFAQASASEREDGLWEAWLEFLPASEDGEPLASERETTQPNRENAKYWAEGLTKVYLEGALQRAISVSGNQTGKERMGTEASRFDSPAQRSRPAAQEMTRTETGPRQHPILDPYSVYSQGEDILRSELSALSRSHVETIASTYGFSPKDSPADLSESSSQTLINAIVEGVRTGEGLRGNPS